VNCESRILHLFRSLAMCRLSHLMAFSDRPLVMLGSLRRSRIYCSYYDALLSADFIVKARGPRPHNRSLKGNFGEASKLA
jgi:hypothetical protein